MLERFVDGFGARNAGLALAAARVAIGVVLVLAPRFVWRLLTGGQGLGDDGLAAVRMLAGRELALGGGALLAARRGDSEELANWVRVSAAADAADALTLLRARGFRRLTRCAAMLSATAAAALGAATARRL